MKVCTCLHERSGGGPVRNAASAMLAVRGRVLRLGRAVSVVAVALALSGRPSAAARAAPAAERVPYDLVVLVVAGPGVPERVALSYAGLVEGERLRGAVERLAAETEARVTGLVVSDEPVERGLQARATAAKFTAEGLLRAGGRLPVAAFAEALAEWRRMRLVFVVDQSFPFAGPDSYATEGFAVTLIKGTPEAAPGGEPERSRAVHVYEYDVVRMKGESAPAAERNHQGSEGPARGGAASRGALMAAVVAAVVVSAAAWFAWSRSKRHSRGQRPRADASKIEAGGESTASENGSNGNGA